MKAICGSIPQPYGIFIAARLGPLHPTLRSTAHCIKVHSTGKILGLGIGDMASAGRIITLSGLGLAAAGALFAGIQSWPIISGSNNNASAASQQVEQKSGAINCANVQTGPGAIDCRTINQSDKIDVPEIEFTVSRSIEDKIAIQFLQNNMDKVVRIKAHVPWSEASDYEDSSYITLGCDPKDFSYDECPAATMVIPKYCSQNPKLPCLLNENGQYILNGFFTTLSSGEKGGYFGIILQYVSPETVRLR
jgi:hypothetical protein